MGAGHTSTLTATPEFHHSQPLEFMITSTSTVPHRQQAFTPESALLTGLSLDLNQSQGSLQIPSFHSRIKNQSQGSTGDAKGWENHRRASPETAGVRHPQEGSGCGNHGQGHGKSSSDDTADDELVKPQTGVVSPALTGTQQCAEIWQTIQILHNHENVDYY